MYLLVWPTGPIPQDILRRVGEWIRAHAPNRVLEHPPGIWRVFATEKDRDRAAKRIDRNPSTIFPSDAFIWPRPVYIELGSMRDQDTDKILYELAVWATTQTPLQLERDGTTVAPETLVHPRRYHG